MGVSQDGNREFITFILVVCVDGSRILFVLIYKSESGAIMDTWLNDYDDENEITYFAATQKGWSNENIGVYWLEHIFDRHTKEKADNHRRLLIVDGHNSHLNIRFINYANQNRILLTFLPPHSTHRLQPLDVGLFGPLANYYTQEIDRFVAEYQSYVTISKRHFWKFFLEAYNRAFTKENVESGWAATGIYPFKPQRVLARLLKRKRKSKIPQDSPSKTPGLTRALRKTYRRLHAEGYINNEAAVLVRAGEKFVIKNKVLRKENEGLRGAIFEEKRKRKRKKAFNFYKEGEQEGQTLFFSPAKVARARERVAAQEEAEIY